MAIRFEGQHLFLNINDLLRPNAHARFLSSFPLHKRGYLGQKAHLRLQAARSKTYGLFHREYHLRREFEFDDFDVTVQGRIDGIYQLENRIEVEEIKSVLLSPKAFKELRMEAFPGYTDQLLFYAYFLEEEFPEAELFTFLLLINLTNDKERVFKVDYRRPDVDALVRERLSMIIDNRMRQLGKLQLRQVHIRNIDFALEEQRPQQEEMMGAVRTCLSGSRHLMASAPTGTGKTIGALFPAVEYAWLQDKKLFFATPKTTQQVLAAQTVQLLLNRGLDVSVIILRAAEKMCANDVFFCHETYCPFARDYRTRLDASDIIPLLLKKKYIHPDDIYRRSVEETLCPFEVSLDLAVRADVIIGDYNYVFDPAVRLNRFFARKDYADWILILDEAHNLYERGMHWLSPELKRTDVLTLMKALVMAKGTVEKKLYEALEQIDQGMEKLQQEGALEYPANRYMVFDPDLEFWNEAFRAFETVFIRYLIQKIKRQRVVPDDPIESLYYTLRHLVHVLDFKDPSFVAYYDAGSGGRFRIQCCDPSAYLNEGIERFHSVVAMSATLEPMEYYRELLGFDPDRTQYLRLGSPFNNTRRKALIIPGISTRYKDRLVSAPKIAETIRTIVQIKPGNYLVFFPSFEYLQQVYLFLGNAGTDVLLQKPQMKEEQRAEYLEMLRNDPRPHLLMGVTGGIFAEGVDYPAEMAIGVIIVSPSLPAVSYERELLKQYFDEKKGSGMAYAYIYPGMNKVIQAAGRLIRTSEDRGIMVLIGERFTEEVFTDLLPEYWFGQAGDVEITDDYQRAIRAFWNREG